MTAFVLRPRAELDIKDIARYTEAKWGRLQRTRYLEALDARISMIADNPYIGRPCDEFGAGYRRARYRHHVIFFVASNDRIEVIRVLHERMNFATHIP